MLSLALVPTLLTLLPVSATQSFHQAEQGPVEAVQASAPPLALERGAGLAPYHAPRNEELVFRVHVDVAMLEAAIGRVTLTSTVEPYQKGVLGGGEEAAEGLETAVLRAHAKGDYTLYSMDATIETRILPLDDPRITYRYTHKGTERRRREVQVSERDGEMISAYREDTSKGAPKGKRIWKKPKERAVPDGTIDMLSAVYFARELMQRDLSSLTFPLIDKDRVWQMNLTLGAEKRLELPAGTFDAVEVVLSPAAYPGEDIDSKKVKKFVGLFGIKGSVHLWVERNTGVPIRIQGSMPAGPVTLGVDIVLQEAHGTSPLFRQVD